MFHILFPFLLGELVHHEDKRGKRGKPGKKYGGKAYKAELCRKGDKTYHTQEKRRDDVANKDCHSLFPDSFVSVCLE
jgi:hypothetical protein